MKKYYRMEGTGYVIRGTGKAEKYPLGTWGTQAESKAEAIRWGKEFFEDSFEMFDRVSVRIIFTGTGFYLG